MYPGFVGAILSNLNWNCVEEALRFPALSIPLQSNNKEKLMWLAV